MRLLARLRNREGGNLYTKAEKARVRRMKQHSAYLRAYEDLSFLNSDEVRPVRLQLE